MQKSYLRGLQYKREKKKEENLKQNIPKVQNEPSKIETMDDTAERLGEQHKVTSYYNNERYQWDLAKLSPMEYYQYLLTGVYPLTIPKSNGRD